MSEDDAAHPRDRNVKSISRAVLVGNCEQVQRCRRLCLEIALDSGELGRLMLERVESMLVAEEDL
jgi:hypothetical protein